MAELDLLGVVPEVKEQLDDFVRALSEAGHGIRWHEQSLADRLEQAKAEALAAQPDKLSG